MLEFVKLEQNDARGIGEMSAMATAIVREHFDPLIGKEQNDYMLAMFQTPSAIAKQLESGYAYYFVRRDGKDIGFLAFYPRQDAMYLSKFYLYREERGRGYANQMLAFVEREALKQGKHAVELNVNRGNSAVKAYRKMGFEIIREEKNDIGNGFYMDDYVFRKEIREKGSETMSAYTEKAIQLRSQFKPNGMPAYNCAQTMVMALAEETGLEEETLKKLTEHFGGGMKMGSVCGAYTGGLMILGLLDINDNESRNRFIHSLKAKHEGMIDCRDLLKANAEKGGDKKTHCDGMILDAIAILEEIISERKNTEKQYL